MNSEKKIPVREGYVGEMLEDTPNSKYFNKILKGGPKQWEFIEWWDRDFDKVIEEIYILNLK